ncbi:MAG: hypothetical protein ACUVWB_11055, partial [Anaerolineae bacterium]
MNGKRKWIIIGLLAGLAILAMAMAVPALAQGPGWLGSRYGGMMGGWYGGRGWAGCPGGYGAGFSSTPTTPLTVAEAQDAVESFLPEARDGSRPRSYLRGLDLLRRIMPCVFTFSGRRAPSSVAPTLLRPAR